MTQQTTQVNQPDLEVRTICDSDGDAEDSVDDVVKALEEATARGDIDIQTLGDKVAEFHLQAENRTCRNCCRKP